MNCKDLNTCADTKTYKCQYCLDYENCFNQYSDDTVCKSWNSTKCPFGEVLPDYSNENRIQNTKLHSNVIYVNPNDTHIYNCPIYKQFPLSFGFYKLFLFSNKTLRNSLNPSTILISDKFEFIMHNIDTIIDVDVDYKYTYALAYPVSVDKIISFADFRNMTIRKEIEKTIDYDYLQEQVPSASILELIENKTKLVKDVFKINSTSYKCLSKKSLSNQTHSVYIIVRAEIETLNLNVSDIVYSNSSGGYFETISEIDYINTFKYGTKTYVKTNLAFCDEFDSDGFHQMINETVIDYFKTSVKQFCYDSLDYKGVYVLDEEYRCLNSSLKFIANRKSNGFVGEIIGKKQTSNYIIFELRPILDENELLPKQVSRISFDAETDFSFTADFEIRPKFGISTSKYVFYDFLEFQLDVDFIFAGFLSAKIKSSLSYTKTLKKWDNVRVKSTSFLLPYLLIPSNIEIRMDGRADLTCSVAQEFEFSKSFEKRFNNKFLIRDDNVNGKTRFDVTSSEIPIYFTTPILNFNLTGSCSLIVNITITLKLNIGVLDSASLGLDEISSDLKQARDLQSKIAEAIAKLIDKILPDFIIELFRSVKQKYSAVETIINNNFVTRFFFKEKLDRLTSLFNTFLALLDGNVDELLKLEDALIKEIDTLIQSASLISGSIGIPTVFSTVLATCSDICTDPAAPFYFYVGLEYFITKEISILSFKKQFDNILNPIKYPKYVCFKAPLFECDVDKSGKCKECSLCPNGKPKEKLENGKLGCPCLCKNNKQSQQLPDKGGECDCSCPCLDGSLDTYDPNGCPCKCICYKTNCFESIRVNNSLTNNCFCPEFYDRDCPWENCQKKCCKNCPAPPPEPLPPPSTGGYTDIHFYSLDGLNFDFQELGDFYFCLNQMIDLGIQIRADTHNSVSSVSWMTGIAVKLHRTKLVLLSVNEPTPLVYFDKNAVLSPFYNQFEDVILSVNGLTISIERKNFFSIFVTYHFFYTTGVKNNLFGFFKFSLKAAEHFY